MTDDQPKKRPPTSTDVAKTAGVSRTTVSYVLNGTEDGRISQATRAKVLAAVRQLGYAPNAQARLLRAGTSDVVLMPMPRDPLGPMFDTLLSSLSTELADRGLTLLIQGHRHIDDADAARGWAELRPAAVMVDVERAVPDTLKTLGVAGIDSVLAYGNAMLPGVPTVVFDDRAIGEEVARHLLARGHQRVACLVPGGRLGGLAEGRFAGLAAALEAGEGTVDRIPVDRLLYQQLQALFLWRPWNERPTALFAYNDEHAMMAMNALQNLGLAVPQDVAVVGADNLDICTLLRPRLTSVAIDMAAMARMTADVLRGMVDGTRPSADVDLTVLPQLTVRESG